MSQDPGSIAASVDGAPADEDATDAPTGDGVSELASVGGAPSLAEQRTLRSPGGSLRRAREDRVDQALLGGRVTPPPKRRSDVTMDDA